MLKSSKCKPISDEIKLFVKYILTICYFKFIFYVIKCYKVKGYKSCPNGQLMMPCGFFGYYGDFWKNRKNYESKVERSLGVLECGSLGV